MASATACLVHTVVNGILEKTLRVLLLRLFTSDESLPYARNKTLYDTSVMPSMIYQLWIPWYLFSYEKMNITGLHLMNNF